MKDSEKKLYVVLKNWFQKILEVMSVVYLQENNILELIRWDIMNKNLVFKNYIDFIYLVFKFGICYILYKICKNKFCLL